MQRVHVIRNFLRASGSLRGDNIGTLTYGDGDVGAWKVELLASSASGHSDATVFAGEKQGLVPVATVE